MQGALMAGLLATSLLMSDVSVGCRRPSIARSLRHCWELLTRRARRC